MRKIRIKNFGPIKDGFTDNNGFMDIKKVTVFIGNQGSGKSTVAKLISTMTWLEKALVRGELKISEIENYNRFRNKHCAYQGLNSYFSDDTEIEYNGNAYLFSYKNGYFHVLNKQRDLLKNNVGNYIVPKIMYVPSERNFVSAVDNPSALKKLPNTLYTFLDEFENAKIELKESVELPINNVKFEYQKQNKISYIVGKDYKIRLSESSSGFQSLVPLFIVSQYLALSINKQPDASKRTISVEEGKRIKQIIEKILANDNLLDDVKKASLEVLSSRFKNSCFINIVEEPEQNLYPASQKNILYKLTEFANMNPGNELILTTHSPYLINYLTLAIKAYLVLQEIEEKNKQDEFTDKLESIIKANSCISPEEAIVYELDIDGNIKTLETYEGLPSDENYLNLLLEETNDLFANLLGISRNL